MENLVSPNNLANNFLIRGKNEDLEITPLKLQKLIYFLYATYLKASNKKMFTEQFEVWDNGPVIPSIYEKFGSYGNRPIKTLARNAKNKAYTIEEQYILHMCIETVWGKYKNLSDKEIAICSCQEGTAWSKALKRRSPYLDDSEIYDDGTEIAVIECINKPKAKVFKIQNYE